MYTMMMMTALSTAPDTVQFNGFFRDLFHGNSCNGNTASSSASDPKAGCTGCNGCNGGGLFHGLFSRSSNSSCQGSSCNGNTNRSASCNGNTSRGSSCNGNGKAYASSCNGTMPMYASSCFGSSCFGSSWSQGSMPYGMPYDMAQPVPANYGAYGGGCFGSGGSMGMPSQAPFPEAEPYPTIPSPSVPMIPRTMPFPEAQPRPIDGSSTYKVPVDSQRATVIVKLPADAKLYAEGRQLLLTSAERKFVTPPLVADRDAIYSFRVEYVRDGEVITQTKKVYVQAGGIVNVEFNELQSKALPAKPNDVFTAFAPLK